jgi:hypothetical protein
MDLKTTKEFALVLSFADFARLFTEVGVDVSQARSFRVSTPGCNLRPSEGWVSVEFCVPGVE